MANIILTLKQKMMEQKQVTKFCMNQNCCYIPCKYNAKRSKNPQSFAFFEGTHKCKRMKLF